VHDVDLGLQFEELAGEMTDPADPGRTVGDLAGILLREGCTTSTFGNTTAMVIGARSVRGL
jgi:hypothetical protein